MVVYAYQKTKERIWYTFECEEDIQFPILWQLMHNFENIGHHIFPISVPSESEIVLDEVNRGNNVFPFTASFILVQC